MIIWGGSRPGRQGGRLLYDGAAYDPQQDRWRRLAPTDLMQAPTPTINDKGADLHAAWTGQAMLVWSATRSAVGGALYEPERDRWEPIPLPPPEVHIPRSGGSAIWTGKELVLWGGGRTARPAYSASDPEADVVGEGAAYDPQTRSWSALPGAPIDPRAGHAAIWTGEGMLVWGGWHGARYRPDGAIYVPE